jgi:hypothetical protein
LSVEWEPDAVVEGLDVVEERGSCVGAVAKLLAAKDVLGE